MRSLSLRHWFTSMVTSTRISKRPVQFRPKLESLEHRFAPAVTDITSGATFATIQAAVTAADPGDTIVADADTYAEHVVIDKTLTLLGANAGVNPTTSVRGAESIVDGTNTGGGFQIAADDVVIDGFRIINALDGANAGVGTSAGVEGYLITNNIFSFNVMGVYANSSGAATISNNLFDSNNTAGPAGGTGIYSDQGSIDLTITGNEFKGHTLNNPVLFAVTAGVTHENLTFTKNNIHDNTSGVYIIGVDGGKFSCNDFSQNTLAGSEDHTALTFAGSNTNIEVEKNDFSNNARGVRIANLDDFAGVEANSDIRVHFNDFSDISDYGLGIVDEGFGAGYSGDDLDARFNWWGSATGPTVAGNPGGTGSAIVNDFASPEIIFAPFLITAPTATTLFFFNVSGNLLTADPATGAYTFYFADGTTISGTGARVQHGVLKIHDQASTGTGGKQKIDVTASVNGPVTVNLRGKNKTSFSLDLTSDC